MVFTRARPSRHFSLHQMPAIFADSHALPGGQVQIPLLFLCLDQLHTIAIAFLPSTSPARGQVQITLLWIV